LQNNQTQSLLNVALQGGQQQVSNQSQQLNNQNQQFNTNLQTLGLIGNLFQPYLAGGY
jgi:hypothetical protein